MGGHDDVRYISGEILVLPRSIIHRLHTPCANAAQDRQKYLAAAHPADYFVGIPRFVQLYRSNRVGLASSMEPLGAFPPDPGRYRHNRAEVPAVRLF